MKGSYQGTRQRYILFFFEFNKIWTVTIPCRFFDKVMWTWTWTCVKDKIVIRVWIAIIVRLTKHPLRLMLVCPMWRHVFRNSKMILIKLCSFVNLIETNILSLFEKVVFTGIVIKTNLKKRQIMEKICDLLDNTSLTLQLIFVEA